MDDWTPERIAELPNIKSVKNLRENARKRGNNAVVVLCDADLAQRTPVRKRPRRVQVSFESRKHRVVVGFHFVCNTDNGLDGTFWTATWVVAKVHAERAEKVHAYVALHRTKAEPSYRQGNIKGWRPGRRGEEAKTEFGVDFLFEPTSKSYQWNGTQAGEKGYLWAASTI